MGRRMKKEVACYFVFLQGGTIPRMRIGRCYFGIVSFLVGSLRNVFKTDSPHAFFHTAYTQRNPTNTSKFSFRAIRSSGDADEQSLQQKKKQEFYLYTLHIHRRIPQRDLY